MTRGVAHSPELRAEAVAAVLAGMSLAQAAQRFGISKGTLQHWLEPIDTVGTSNARDPETLADLILDLIADHVTTIRAQLQTASRPDWVAQQSAADLAQLVAVERDTTLRLLAGLRPVADAQPTPELDAPRASEGA